MNKEGVEYSMTQWFPKLCEFDHHGWHTNPYIGREFHGIWGNYDVHIHLPKATWLGPQASVNPKRIAHSPQGSPGTIHHYKAEQRH